MHAFGREIYHTGFAVKAVLQPLQNNATAERLIQMTCVMDFPMLPSALGFVEKLVPLLDVL